MYAKSAASRRDAKRPAGTIHDASQARKWALQRAAQGLLADKRPRIDRFGNEREHFIYRVAMCHRGTDGLAPEIRRSTDHERAEFYGVQTCGSVWHCPICAPKIANGRRDEMTLAMGRHVEAGRMVFLETFTFQHTAEEGGAGCLKPQLDKLLGLMRDKLKSHRVYKDTRREAEVLGQIRALEITFGEMNGWHPHVHELVFASRDAVEVTKRGETIYRKSVLGRRRKLWAQILIEAGMAGLKKGDTGAELFGKLRNLLRRCYTVQIGAYAAEYIAKFGRESGWGIASEMTRGHTKTPRRCSHTTPWGLLADHLDGDKRAGWLFREYAEAFAGRRQLYWSPGLKKALGVEDVADEEIAAAPDASCSERVIQLTDDQWRLILSRNARWEALRAAALNGRFGVEVLLRELGEVRPTHGGDYTESGRAFVPIRRHA